MQWSAPCGGAAAAAEASSVPSQEAPVDASAPAVSATIGGVPVSSCSSSLQQRSKRALLTGGSASRGNSSSKGPPISAEALRRFFGLKEPSVCSGDQKGGQLRTEKRQPLGPPAPGDPSNSTRVFPASCRDAGAPTAYAAAAAADADSTIAANEDAAAHATPKRAPSAANTSERGPETTPLGSGDAGGAVCWRLKRPLRSCGSTSLSSKLRCTASSTSHHAAAVAPARGSSSNSKPLASTDYGWMGLKYTTAAAALQQTRTLSSRAAAAASTAAPAAPTAAARNASRSDGTPEVAVGGTSGRKNAHSVADPKPAPAAAAAAAAASSAGSSRTAAARQTRPWAELPDPLVLQVLDFGGREISMTCRRFAALIRRQRRVLRFSGDASTASSAEALIRAIMSSPSLRLLEITAGGGLSASQMERLSRARSSALPQKLQVLVMRRCNKMSDKSLRTLLLRLRDLRCVDLRDCFSLTDEALLTLGFLPRLERVALGLTAGARGCCRLTCRALKALLTPQRQEQQQQKQQQKQQHQQQQGQGQTQQRPPDQAEEGCIAPIKFLSLARCSEMKDFTVLANAKATLEFLDLRGTAIDDSSAHVFAELHNLQVLVLADTAVTTTTVSAVVDGCPKLQMLDLSCTGPVSRDCLFRLAFSLPSISRLKLSHTAAIDDVLLAHLLAELPLLRFLDVSHCWRVTSAFCDAHFIVASGKQLKRLGLFGCNVERQRVEAALIVAGATNARLSLHNEMALFEMPRVYATMKGLDI
ncbi:Chromosome II, complete genome, related [Eimeria mitis]|uniref:Chromosome II, complete genome, related n=1 Tax=Eimeria mitis TaxID=44415 RepID=U6KDR7_9EIME|nr:Chromosome II, complete genome, related [Eimeria mitis]CDJ36180.1 Chromosome II, complete genome, related [Eimeria mitis]